jgi:polysaccharide deacetylase family protein (PEP-CTERM system associated)
MPLNGAHVDRGAGRTPGQRGFRNVLTVDVEEYFHPNAMDAAVDPSRWDALPSRVEHNTHRVLDLLSEHDVHATFFVLGWVAERVPRLVVEIARRGHEIACHGYAHRLVYRLGPQRFRDDVARGKRILEDCIGSRVAGFRAASCSIIDTTLWALDILIEEGFEYDSSIFPVRHDIYGIPGFHRFAVRLRRAAGEIVEIPLSTVHLLGRNWPVAGGGYLRIFPYWITRLSVQRLNRREHAPAIVYVHPWELDIDQPRLPAGALSRFRHYTNLRRSESRLRRLLDDFAFAPIRDAICCADVPVQPPGP